MLRLCNFTNRSFRFPFLVSFVPFRLHYKAQFVGVYNVHGECACATVCRKSLAAALSPRHGLRVAGAFSLLVAIKRSEHTQ